MIILLLIAALLLLKLPGLGDQGPAPGLTSKIISVVPATAQQKASDRTTLGTVLVQRNDGYQLLLVVHHATGNGCLGDFTLHLSDIKIGETTAVRYWLDKPETSANPHRGHAVYIGNRC
ncbi:MAG: hypothetical protein H0V70_18645 [Ktedonobacteraceae bacterium]|nr:hypothetical protein [Ktedonobacteraceae bacterium]